MLPYISGHRSMVSFVRKPENNNDAIAMGKIQAHLFRNNSEIKNVKINHQWRIPTTIFHKIYRPILSASRKGAPAAPYMVKYLHGEMRVLHI